MFRIHAPFRVFVASSLLAFAAGALGFMAIASLSMRCSRWLTEFFDPLRQ